MGKKKWKTPKIIVLTRGKPDEAVMDACKAVYAPMGAMGPGGCFAWGPGPCSCFDDVPS